MIRARVIMVPTDQQGRKVGDLMKIISPRDGEKFGDLFVGERDTYPIHNAHYQHQHLHFISNEEMKIGDWNITGNIKRHNHAIRRIIDARDLEHFTKMCLIMSGDKIPKQVVSQKIIASTDPSLNLPGISQSFLQEYVKSNGSIMEVFLKQEISGMCNCGKSDYGYVCSGNCTEEEYAQSFTTTLKLTENNEVLVVHTDSTDYILENSLSAFENALKEIPKEKMDKIISDIDSMNLQGLTVNEYINKIHEENHNTSDIGVESAWFVQMTMLPAKIKIPVDIQVQEDGLLLSCVGELVYVHNHTYNRKEWVPQHLYFLDNGEGWRGRLKSGDQFIFFALGGAEIHKYHSDAGYGIKTYGIKTYTDFNAADGSSIIVSGSRCSGKIIASTDPSLNLACIPIKFLQQYARSSGAIKGAWLKTENHISDLSADETLLKRLKLTDKNEVIIIGNNRTGMLGDMPTDEIDPDTKLDDEANRYAKDRYSYNQGGRRIDCA